MGSSHTFVFLLLAASMVAVVMTTGRDWGLGPTLNPFAPLMVAGLQGAMVLLFCMRLKSESPLIYAIALVPLLLVAIILGLNPLDASLVDNR
jgi:hypothetical protein